MKIVDNRTKAKVRYSELFPGDVWDCNGDPAIMTVSGDSYLLTDGCMVKRDNTDLVQILKAEVVIH